MYVLNPAGKVPGQNVLLVAAIAMVNAIVMETVPTGGGIHPEMEMDTVNVKVMAQDMANANHTAIVPKRAAMPETIAIMEIRLLIVKAKIAIGATVLIEQELSKKQLLNQEKEKVIFRARSAQEKLFNTLLLP